MCMQNLWMCNYTITWWTTGILFLEEVVNTFGGEGINAIVDAAGKRFQESLGEKAAGSPAWWRVSAFWCFNIVTNSVNFYFFSPPFMFSF